MKACGFLLLGINHCQMKEAMGCVDVEQPELYRLLWGCLLQDLML